MTNIFKHMRAQQSAAFPVVLDTDLGRVGHEVGKGSVLGIGQSGAATSEFATISAKFGGISHILHMRRNPLGFFCDIHKRHGDNVRLNMGPHQVWLVTGPPQINALLMQHERNVERFQPALKIMSQWFYDSALLGEGPRAQGARRVALAALARDGLRNNAKILRDRTHAAVEGMLAGNSGQYIDLEMFFRIHILQNVTHALMGVEEACDQDRFVEMVYQSSEIIVRELTSLLPQPDFMPTRRNRRKRRAIGVIREHVSKIVELRMEVGVGHQRQDVLAAMIHHLDGDKEQICNEIVTLIIAGFEPTAAALTWAFYLMGRHPETVDVLQSELDEVIGTSPVELDDLGKLPQLERTVLEVLRLYPTAYALFPRKALCDFDLGGLPVKQGDLLQVSPYLTHHSEKWHPAPDRFMPDRFRTSPAPGSYLPFGAGPRGCIGQRAALMEIAVVMATVLQRVTPGPVEKEVPTNARFFLRPSEPILQQWFHRSKNRETKSRCAAG